MIENLTEIIQNALKEDVSNIGDITSLATISKEIFGNAKIVSKEDGIIAGGFIVDEVFSIIDSQVEIEILYKDGTRIQQGQEVIKIYGPIRSILTGERTALNFLCRLSGIASLTSQFVNFVKDTKIKILDTRKTTPGLRLLEKYAVRMGGGQNHRIGLYDMILIKENHIAAAGGIEKAVYRCREYMSSNSLNLKIEVETTNLNEVHQALSLQVDRIMLDNMTIDQIKDAVVLVDGKAELEISGGVDLDNIEEYTKTGVDYISIGCLTHSPKAMDFSLLVEE